MKRLVVLLFFVSCGVFAQNTSPTALCMDINVQLDLSGNASIVPADVDAGSSDMEGPVTLSLDISSFTCAELGPNTVTLTVTDTGGLTDSCTATVTITETIEPLQANCMDITIVLDAAGMATIVPQDLDDTANPSTGDRSCGSLNFSSSQTSFDCNQVLKVPPPRDLVLTGVIGDTVSGGRPKAIELYTIRAISGSELARYAVGSANPADGLVVPQYTFPTDAHPAGTYITLTTDQALFSSFFGGLATYQDAVAPNIDGNDVVSLFYDGVVIDTFGDINAVEIEPGVELGRLDSWAYTDGWAYRVNDTEVNGTAFEFENWIYGAPGSLEGQTGNPTPFPSGLGIPIGTYGFTFFGSPSPIQVDLTVDDGNGNTDTCVANVTVIDNTDPVMSCQNITRQLDAMGVVRVEASELYVAPATDACGILKYKVDPSVFSCTDIGANSVTVTVTDVFGNETSCTSVVTIEDNLAPTAACANITVPLDANGNATITADDVFGSSADACGIPTRTIDVSTFDCSNVGPNNVVLTLTDSNGNTSSCTAVVTIIDTVQPDAICQNITIQLDASGNATLNASQINNGSTDACGIASTNVDITSFTCADIGNNTVTLTATDVNGNSNTCTANVVVEDSIPPNAVAMDITVTLDSAGNAFIIGADVDNGSSDNCAVAGLSVSPDNFTCADVSAPVPVVLTVTDTSGNTATASANVTVQDTSTPVANCANLTIALDASGMVTIAPEDVDDGSSVSCGAATLTLDQNTFDCMDIGNNNVTLTVTNSNGLSASCTAVVTIVDQTPPAVSCQDILVILDGAGNATITASQIDAGSSDACGIAGIELDVSVFNCNDIGVNPVVLTVTDTQGNMSSCTANVTVVDDQSPTAVCQNINVQLDGNGVATIVATDVDDGSFDLCGIADMQIDVSNFDCSNLGANPVQLTVTDSSGNSDICTAVVTVQDNVPPTVLCQNITIALDASGTAFITAADIDNGSSDACGIASMSVSNTLFTCSNVGANAVNLTVTDTSGNTSFCTAIVTVQDNLPPSVLCQNISVMLDASGVATIIANDIDAGTNDACGIASIIIDTNTFTCDDLGVVPVTLTATDIYGNSASCTADVTVLDGMAPQISCPNNQTEFVTSGSSFTVPDYFANGLVSATDNCTDPIVDVQQNPPSGTVLGLGTYTIEVEVTDASGNSSECDFELVVTESLSIGADQKLFELIIFPNPGSDKVYLKTNGQFIQKLALYDLNGRVLVERVIQNPNTEIPIDVREFPAGVYLMIIETESGTSIKQLIKE